MTDFYFAISLKPKINSDNWGFVIANLQQTLNSIENSSNRNYHILISTYDPEDLTSIINNKNTTLINPNFEPPSSPQEGNKDKLKNRYLIGSYLRDIKTKPFYVMFLDADDLIHKNLVEYVLSEDNHKGYIISEGYILDIDKREFRRKLEFNTTCGSCYIGYFYPEELPKSYNDIECYYSKHKGPSSHIRVAAEKRRMPNPIPFPSAIYLKGHLESLENARKKKKITKSNVLKRLNLFLCFERYTRILLNKTNKKAFEIKQDQAKNILKNDFGLKCAPDLEVIIVGKRKLPFLNSLMTKTYNKIYRKIR